jgi:hypothetical protein
MRLRLEESEPLLHRLCATPKNIMLVIDGLDECERHVRAQLLTIVDGLIKRYPQGVKALIASRRDPDIDRRLRKGMNVDIEATDNQGDIMAYLKDAVANAREEWIEVVPVQLRNDIVTRIHRDSHGM